jgi:hypothetical protein
MVDIMEIPLDNDFESLQIDKFFLEIKKRVVEFLTNKNGIEPIISKIIEDSKNLSETYNYISENFCQNLINFFNNEKNFFIEENNNNNKKITKFKKKAKNFGINKEELDLIENDKNLIDSSFPCTLENIKITPNEKEIFEKVAIKLKLKKIIERIMEIRILKSVNQHFAIVPGLKTKNFLIPDKNDNNFQYHLFSTNKSVMYVNCADTQCKGRGKIDKFNYKFSMIHEHSKEFKEHTYVIHNNNKNNKKKNK